MIYLDGIPVPTTRFPDNTTQVWKLPEKYASVNNKVYPNFAKVEWVFQHEGEFMELAQLVRLLNHYEVGAELRLSYLPYGRQDKDVDNKATFALHVFADLLNGLGFRKVFIVDPHSEVALKLIKNSVALYPKARVEQLVEDLEIDVVCYPDKGAFVKYVPIHNTIQVPHIAGFKVRNQLTGHIESYEIKGDVAGRNVMIIDDICDGGATFTILAKDLMAKGAKSVVLFVTHGIFSKGTRVLFEAGIKRVFTLNDEVGPREWSKQF